MSLFVDPSKLKRLAADLFTRRIKGSKPAEYTVNVSSESNGAIHVYIKHNGRYLGDFHIMEYPSCCGVCLGYDLKRGNHYKNLGIRRALNYMMIKVAKQANYTILIYIEYRLAFRRRAAMMKNGWSDMLSFFNGNTDNWLKISYIRLRRKNPIYMFRNWLVKYRHPLWPKAIGSLLWYHHVGAMIAWCVEQLGELWYLIVDLIQAGWKKRPWRKKDHD